jgi:hypothetical protein
MEKRQGIIVKLHLGLNARIDQFDTAPLRRVGRS